MRDIDNYTEKYLDHNDFEKYQVIYRRRKILEYIEKYNHDNILEIGCGMEPIGKFIDDLEAYTIVEPSETFVENAQKIFNSNPKVNLIHGFLEECTEVLSKEKFSFIIISSLLHEVESPQLLIKSVKKIASNNTIIHVNVPNGNSFHRLLALESGIINHVTEFSNNNKIFQQHTIFTMDTLLSCIKDSLNCDVEILDSGSYWVKPFTHKQMAMMMNENIINENILDGFEKMVKYMPELGSEIFVNFRIKDC